MIAAAVQHLWGLRWLPGTLAAVAGGTGVAAAGLVLLLLACFGGGAAWTVWRLLRRPAPVPLALALALTWGALDWTLARLPFGLAFPWAPLGLGLAEWPDAVALAELLGPSGLTVWVASVNGLVAAALLALAGGPASTGRGRRTAPRASVGLAAAAALALAPVLWGARRAGGLEERPVGTVVALALPGEGAGEGEGPAGARVEAALAAVRGLPTFADTVSGPDLVVLPEMAFPVDWGTPAAGALEEMLADEARRLGAPLLVGTRTAREGRARNAAVLVGGEPFVAEKRRLVPGAERAAVFAPAWLAPPSAAGYAPGSGWPVLRAGPLRAGVLVCWEAAFAPDARRLVRGGAETLVAISSDAWFGGGSRARAAGIAQQLAHLRLRAVETRRPVIRSALGGPAALVEPDGRLTTRAAGSLPAELRAPAAHTLYVRSGDWTGPAAVALLVLLLAPTRRPRPGGSPVRPTGTRLAALSSD